MPDYIVKSDAKQTSTLGKVKVLVEQVVGSPSQEAISQAVADYIEAHPGSLSPLSAATKAALLQIAEKVAYIDEHGQDYYNALNAALSAVALLQITAVYTQSGTVYDTDSLDSLKSDLVVTAYYDDGTNADVTNAAVLSGTLEVGTSTITATYEDKTDTFDVVVSAPLYAFENGTHAFTTYPHIITVENGNVVTIQHAANGHDIKANVSTVSTNGTTGNAQTNYAVSTPFFTIPNGSVVRTVVIPREVTYSTTAMGSKAFNFIYNAVDGTTISGVAFMHNKALNSLVVDTPIEETATMTSNVVVGCVGTWMGNSSTATATVKVELRMYVDGVRWI